jgi:hypothetical protein
MTLYVIKRIEDGKFVAAPNSERSYTSDLTKARTFATRTEAVRECCGNEQVWNVSDLLRHPA